MPTKRPFSLVSLLTTSAFAFLLTAGSPVLAQTPSSEVTVYTTREVTLIEPLLKDFTARSGIKVNTVFVKDGLLERVKAEGARSPADVLMTVDIGNLIDLVESGLTQALKSSTLEAAVPAHLRAANGHWTALSLRARVLYAEAQLKPATVHYEDLADPKWKGKICVRSGQHPYNTALVAAMIAHHGEAKTEQWLRGLKANLGRKPIGGDRDVARDILGGICDIGLANSYYVGQMKAAKPGTDARKWGDGIQVLKPTFATRDAGTHINISGASIARHAPHKAAAQALLEFLVSVPAQQAYAQANYEYPVREGVSLDPLIQAAIGPLKADNLPLGDIAKYRKQASLLIDKVGFDQ